MCLIKLVIQCSQYLSDTGGAGGPAEVVDSVAEMLGDLLVHSCLRRTVAEQRQLGNRQVRLSNICCLLTAQQVYSYLFSHVEEEGRPGLPGTGYSQVGSGYGQAGIRIYEAHSSDILFLREKTTLSLSL